MTRNNESPAVKTVIKAVQSYLPKAPPQKSRKEIRAARRARMFKEGMRPKAHETFSPRVQELLSMLSYRRPSGSAEETAFAVAWVSPLGAKPDVKGNWWLEIPKADGSLSPILWCAHLDTVHRVGGRQNIVACSQWVGTDSPGSNCLGADDTVGVWILRQMALAGVPGRYVWHTQEETGGKGSAWVVKKAPQMLSGITYAIAFDRAGYQDIITHQFGDRCCSEAFAASVSRILGGLDMKACSGGVFTDTAHYVDLVPECTNLSVGYGRQHTDAEFQDLPFAEALLDAVLAGDWGQLVEQRKAGETEPVSWTYHGKTYTWDRQSRGYRNAAYDTEEDYDVWWEGDLAAVRDAASASKEPDMPEDLDDPEALAWADQAREWKDSAPADQHALPGLRLEAEPDGSLRISADIAARQLIFREINESGDSGGMITMAVLLEGCGMDLSGKGERWQVVEALEGGSARRWVFESASAKPWYPLMTIGQVIFRGIGRAEEGGNA